MDFKKLAPYQNIAQQRTVFSLFEQANRAEVFSVQAPYSYLDYAKQNITADELSLLIEQAKTSSLPEKLAAQFSGDKINNTEGRAVLHTALRATNEVKRQVLLTDADQVIATEVKMAKLVADIQQGHLRSAFNKKFTDVIAVGIGGSYYGVKVALSGLTSFHDTGLKAHVVANIDGAAVSKKLATLDVETTLVVVISKTFTTQETRLNAQAIKQWMLAYSSKNDVISKQFFAVSSNVDKAVAFGLNPNNVLPMWDWVGGRFSIWSAVGFPLALVIGNDNFSAFKEGAKQMDDHFKEQPFEQNMPVILALLGIWNRNVLKYPTLAILPYDHSLRALPGYLQQTDMESNGKSVATNGDKLTWATAPVVFGQEGTNGQHAFMQLMHQSDDIIPTDFIVCLRGSSQLKQHHKVLVANCFAQSEALMKGKTLEQAKAELLAEGADQQQVDFLALHKVMKGNTPSNTIVLESLTPESLGALLALYEHKIFVQGVLWQLNSYDQWGVELAKQLGNKILTVMNGTSDDSLSPSTSSLINKFLAAN